MKSLYANLADLRDYMSLASQNDADDPKLIGLLGRASRSIEKYCRRPFHPTRDTKYYDYRQSQEIRFRHDLLEIDTLATNNGASVLPNGILLLKTGDDYNFPPYDRVVIRTDSGSTFNYSGTDQKASEVTGFWGYHEDYANAWVDTGTSLGGSHVSGASQLTVLGGSTGFSDIDWQAPRFAAGDTLKIGGEMFFAAGGNGTSVNVVPAFNGTSANHHASGVPIYRYEPEADIQWATIRLAAWLNGQAMTPYENKTAFIAIGQISIPSTWGKDIADRLDRFIKPMIVTVPE
jgi:hypothetical protein